MARHLLVLHAMGHQIFRAASSTTTSGTAAMWRIDSCPDCKGWGLNEAQTQKTFQLDLYYPGKVTIVSMLHEPFGSRSRATEGRLLGHPSCSLFANGRTSATSSLFST